MKRRRFLISSAITITGFQSGISHLQPLTSYKDLIIGHGSHRYKIDLNWGALDPQLYPVNDCHEMVMDKQGRIIMLTNHVQNNVIIYDQSGKLIEVWGTEFPGAHGLTINEEEGIEYLYISDNSLHQVIKTTMDGTIVMKLDYPAESGLYESANQYIPTETAIADNGDIYVADGYGLQFIMHYDAQGRLLNTFGGRGESPDSLDNAHGICIDRRAQGDPILLVTDRNRNQLKRYTLSGEYLSTIDLPGAYICRPVIKGEHIYLATIWSDDRSDNTGFISILDKDNRLISAPGGSTPTYVNGKLNSMHQALKIFKHPHDVCIDNDDNLYICQWNAGQSYPIKLIRV